MGGWVGGYKYESGWAERQGARVMPSWQQRTGHTASEAYGWLRRRGPGQSRAGASLAHRGHMRVFPISSDVAATRSSGKGAVQFPAAAPPPFGPFTPPRATQGSPPNHRKYRRRSSERTIYPPCHARPRLTACRQTFNSKRTEYSRCQRHASTISHSCHRVHDKSVACVGSEYGYTMSIVVLKALTPAHPRVNFVLVRYPPSVMKPHRLPPQPSRRPRLTGPSASPHRFASRRPRPSP